ncbi:hypothetical protein [Dietzia sp. PP-33]|uniref:hypothetical protein n=1 Tax=Dietzia sp. PP-33 TaxID=2957500 RepID=UPI0029C01087|nr:hypothetical protein [Dietzia sp. PP-33]
MACPHHCASPGFRQGVLRAALARARQVRVTEAGALVAEGVNDMYEDMAAAVYVDAQDDLEAFLGLFTRLDTFFEQVMNDSDLEDA